MSNYAIKVILLGCSVILQQGGETFVLEERLDNKKAGRSTSLREAFFNDIA